MVNDDNDDKKSAKPIFKCNCGKVYKYRQGLSLHKNKCIYDFWQFY